jgi:cell division protein FtsW (lipid II flippase)/cell division protein FtsI/penicillin-binding protein 2
MRVIAAAEPGHPRAYAAAGRALNVELLGLLASSIVVLLGTALAVGGRFEQAAAADRRAAAPLNLRQMRSAADLEPLLDGYESAAERRIVAEALYARAVGDPPLQHVGGLADASIPATLVASRPGLMKLRARLARRPDAQRVPALSGPDLAALKPAVVVRTRAEFNALFRGALLWFFGAFWSVHAVRRWRRAVDDPILLPALALLTGIGLMTMLALRDPLRDTVSASTFATGVATGLLALLAASEIDFERSALRRAVLSPLAAAFGLATLLLLFGRGPGSSGVKVNLFGFQPVEVIRLLVVFALAAYFSRRLEFLRELSDRPPASTPSPGSWVRRARPPRMRDLRPVGISMLVVLAFFFLQKDLGPALVLSFVFLALYGVARGRAVLAAAGLALLLCGFAAAYWIGYPSTVRQRVAIWIDPWNNGVPGGNQIAQGLWGMATGSVWGSGPGLGGPQTIPAGHTDFVLAAIGEELGLAGLLVVIALYGVVAWRCGRVAMRAPGDYSSLLATGVALTLVVQAFVIASGVLGLFPLSGVVTPFLSYGRSSMLANLFAVGVVMATARRLGAVRAHMRAPLHALAGIVVLAAAAVVSRAVWVQGVHADEIATASSLADQADGGYRFEYNPRLLAAAKLIPRGSIYDRNGLPIATSKPAELNGIDAAYRRAGLTPEQPCAAASARCYPLAGVGFSVLGDWTTQANWGARNSSYVERDNDSKLKGYDDRPRVVDVSNPRTGVRDRTVRRDLSVLLPLARIRGRDQRAAAKAFAGVDHDLQSSLDARLQLRAAAVLRKYIERSGTSRGAAVVLDVDSGEVLASVSYPWPTGGATPSRDETGQDPDAALLDRVRYGLYPPGSTFKLVVAAAAMRARSIPPQTFACVRLPEGRVGSYLPGWTRPVRDDPLDATPHGTVDLRRGLVVSCNAYFAQLALRLGPRPILDAAAVFQIDPSSPPTSAALRRTLPHAGYGQGDVVVSPLKMARVAASIAANGSVVPVNWVHAETIERLPDARFLSDADAARLSSFMREVVTSGTGRTLSANAVAIAGKTGTAEVDGGRAHSWFAGFAPYEGAHRIALAVIVENAGYGARVAAPIAGDIVTAARDLGLMK